MEEGLLLRQRGRVILQLDGGGFYILEGADARFLGSRVRVQGIRIGFNSLDVTGMTPC